MPNFLLLASTFVILYVSYIVQVEMNPDYGEGGGGEDYPNPGGDYPGAGGDYPDPMMGGRGRDPYGHGDYGGGGGGYGGRKNEVEVSQKRFKLYEKRRYGYKRATSFCKKKEGNLMDAAAIQSVQQLKNLFIRAHTIGKDIWVKVDNETWEKHMQDIAEKAKLESVDIPKMCPALSLVNNKALAPLECETLLPFICVYNRDRPRTTRMPKWKRNLTTPAGMADEIAKWKEKYSGKDEMKK